MKINKRATMGVAGVVFIWSGIAMITGFAITMIASGCGLLAIALISMLPDFGEEY
jgi:hypothetical protein